MFNFDFPREDVIKELKEKRLLKNAKAEITAMSIPSSRPIIYFEAHLYKGLIIKHYWTLFSIYMIVQLLNVLKLIPTWLFLTITIYWILAIIIYSLKWKKNTYWKGMGTIEKTDDFTEFLDKFGRGWEIKSAEAAEKVSIWRFFSFARSLGIYGRRWIIEYDILATACEWCRRNPADFKDGFRKAKNKKELRWLMGMR